MDDATLSISVSPEGYVQLVVNDQLIGFLQEICITPLLHPDPNVRVRFISTEELPDGEEKNKLLERMHYFRELLDRCPQVVVVDEVQTLPYMMAVRPSTVPPDQPAPKDG